MSAATPGIYPAMRMADYHALDAASNSRLCHLRRSPAHLHAYLVQPPTDTLALKIGRAVHTAILEPFDFTTNFSIAGQCEATKKGDGLRCSNPGVIFRAEAGWLCGVHGKGLASDESRIVLSAEQMATCTRARDAVMAHPIAGKLISGLQDVELSVVWADAETGVTCKARYDGYVPGLVGGAIIDIKTCMDASPREFARSIFGRGYDLQAAHYLAGAEASDIPAHHFLHIAVEKEVAVAAVYRLHDNDISAGRTRLAQLLRVYDKCMTSGEFPGYSDEIVDISVPEWSWKQIEDELYTRAAEPAA